MELLLGEPVYVDRLLVTRNYLGKYLVYFAAYKNHISVYPATTPAISKIKGLSAYKVSKGTLNFPLDEPIPFELIRKFIRAKIKEHLKNEKEIHIQKLY